MRAPKSTAVKSEENNEGSLTAENSPSSSDSRYFSKITPNIMVFIFFFLLLPCGIYI